MFRDRIFRGVYPLALGQPLPANSAVKTGYAPIRSLKLYNEVHGRGESLVLLHGPRIYRDARRDPARARAKAPGDCSGSAGTRVHC